MISINLVMKHGHEKYKSIKDRTDKRGYLNKNNEQIVKQYN